MGVSSECVRVECRSLGTCIHVGGEARVTCDAVWWRSLREVAGIFCHSLVSATVQYGINLDLLEPNTTKSSTRGHNGSTGRQKAPECSGRRYRIPSLRQFSGRRDRAPFTEPECRRTPQNLSTDRRSAISQRQCLYWQFLRDLRSVAHFNVEIHCRKKMVKKLS